MFAEFRTTHRGTNLVLTLGLDDFPEFGNLFQIDHPAGFDSAGANLGQEVGAPGQGKDVVAWLSAGR